jgi:hypothetical protein
MPACRWRSFRQSGDRHSGQARLKNQAKPGQCRQKTLTVAALNPKTRAVSGTQLIF